MIIRLFQTTQVLFAPSQPSLRGRNLYVEIGGYEQQFWDCLSNTNSNSNSWKTPLAISIAIAIVGKSPQQQQYQQQQCQKRQQQQQFQYYCSCLDYGYHRVKFTSNTIHPIVQMMGQFQQCWQHCLSGWQYLLTETRSLQISFHQQHQLSLILFP